MKHWNINDIAWTEFTPAAIDPALVPIVKAASLVEYNGYAYAEYLKKVFADDAAIHPIIDQWAVEEVQHGEALRRWAELADPSFNFEAAFKRFTTGYEQLPQSVDGSTRGSRCGELIARCIVETGTSSYYTAMKESSDEPVLRAIAAKIAADEHRHYKLFYTALQDYRQKENIGFWRRLWIALGRMRESEDDELAYAYFAANAPEGATYDHKHYSTLYARYTYAIYRKHHIQSMIAMVFKAVGLKPQGRLARSAGAMLWAFFSHRAKRLAQNTQSLLPTLPPSLARAA